MVHAASQRWENGVLVERAIETNRGNAGQREEVEATTAKPYKAPNVTPRSPEDKEEYARTRPQLATKAVASEEEAVEDKAVTKATTKRKRAAKK